LFWKSTAKTAGAWQRSPLGSKTAFWLSLNIMAAITIPQRLAKVSLEKRLAQQAPELVTLVKPLKLTLENNQL
jgi:hypothetical protein